MHLLLGSASIFCMGGIIFGVASLFPILYKEQIFVETCGERLAKQCALRGDNVTATTKCCNDQKLRFTGFASLSIFMSDFGMLTFGELGDWAGPNVAFGTGSGLICSGLFLIGGSAFMDGHYPPNFFGLARPSLIDEILFSIGMLLLGAGGPGVIIGTLSLSEKYSFLRAAVTSLTAAMEDSSALVFLFFNRLYLDHDFGYSFPSICFTWCGFCVALALCTWMVLPTKRQIRQIHVYAEMAARSHQRTLDMERNARMTMRESQTPNGAALGSPNGAALGSQNGAASPNGAQNGATESVRGGAGEAKSDSRETDLTALKPKTKVKKSFRAELLRTDTLLLIAFMSLHNLKSTFFITTFADHMMYDYGVQVSSEISQLFNIAYPVCCVLSALVATLMLDRLGSREDVYMTLTFLLILSFHLATLFPVLRLQYVAVFLFGPARTFQAATYYHLLSQKARYSPEYEGRLVGYGNTMVALIGNVPPYLIDSFVYNSDALGSVARRYNAVDVVLFLLILTSVVLPIYLSRTMNSNVEHDDDDDDANTDFMSEAGSFREVDTLAPPPPPPQMGLRSRVLVPAALWPMCSCCERRGTGWEAIVLSLSARRAKVRFLFARDRDGNPFADATVPRSVLTVL